MKTINILYIHGMGGGGDSRIPGILRDNIEGEVYKDIDGTPVTLRIIIRTYSFDPEIAARTISSWVAECRPALVVGESLGAIQAIRIKGLPHILVSPSLGAPLYLGFCSPLMYIPGLKALLNHIYKPREGDRQAIDFEPSVLRKYISHRKAAYANSTSGGGKDSFFAFFGKKDHYRKTGVVCIRMWNKWFGKGTYKIYDGTHFMEEEYVIGLLKPKILDTLSILPQECEGLS